MEKNIICTSCPQGCEIKVVEQGGKLVSVTGNTCVRGAAYAEAEYFHPERMLTTTVKAEGGKWLSVRSEKPIPKEKIFDAMRVLQSITAPERVRMGQIICENIADTEVNIIATGEI